MRQGLHPWTQIGKKFMAIYHFRSTSAKARQGRASRHGSYIRREGVYAERKDLAHHEHGNMPTWAKENPDEFWKAADDVERSNGRAYREFEVALPRELDLNQQKELVRHYVREQLGERHAYEWAIHDKGDGNPHAHIQFSERTHDGIERDRASYFKRSNPKNPERGGCKKQEGWNVGKGQTPEPLLDARSRWADLQNIHLDRAGKLARVDHRTLEAQGIARVAQIHVGYRDNQAPDVHAERYTRNEAIKVMNQEEAQARREVAASLKEIAEITATLKEITAREELKNFALESLEKFRREMTTGLREVIAEEVSKELKEAVEQRKVEAMKADLKKSGAAELERTRSARDARTRGEAVAGLERMEKGEITKAMAEGRPIDGRNEGRAEDLAEYVQALSQQGQQEQAAQIAQTKPTAPKPQAPQNTPPPMVQQQKPEEGQKAPTPAPEAKMSEGSGDITEGRQRVREMRGGLSSESIERGSTAQAPAPKEAITPPTPAVDSVDAFKACCADIESRRQVINADKAAIDEFHIVKKGLDEPDRVQGLIDSKQLYIDKGANDEKMRILDSFPGLKNYIKRVKEFGKIDKKVDAAKVDIKMLKNEKRIAENRIPEVKEKLNAIESRMLKNGDRGGNKKAVAEGESKLPELYKAVEQQHGPEQATAALLKAGVRPDLVEMAAKKVSFERIRDEQKQRQAQREGSRQGQSRGQSRGR